MSARSPREIPFTVSLDQAPEIESLEDSDIYTDPEAYVCSADHAGVLAALSLLPGRQRQIFCAKIGLGGAGQPRSSAEIAADLNLSVETVSSALTRSRNRLRAIGDIIGIINGEHIAAVEGGDNPLQTS